MELFHFPSMCIYNTYELKLFAKKAVRNFSHWYREKVKKVSVVGDKNVYSLVSEALFVKRKFYRFYNALDSTILIMLLILSFL